MTRRGRRLGLLGVGLVVALAAALPAVAAINPTLDATTQASGTTIGYQQGANDDAPALITFYAPAGYAALLAQSDQTQVGTVKGQIVAGDLGGAKVDVTGTIVVATAATTIAFANSTIPLSAAAATCTGSPTHSAFWLVNFEASGQKLQVPAFVDDVPLTSPLSSTANTQIKICLPAPDVPAGTPGRAAIGAKVVSATLNLTDVFSVAPGWYLWHLIVTPYNPGKGTANPAGSVAAQSYDRTPQEITVTAKAGAGGKAVVRGRVAAGNRGVQGATVSILADKKEIGTAKTGPGGRFKASVDAASGTELTVSASAPTSKASCQQGWFPVNCVNAVYPSFTVTSEPTAVS